MAEPTRLELLQEANKRGLLSGQQKALFDEAERRGLIGGPQPIQAESQPEQESAGGSTRRTPGQALLSVASSVIAEPIAGLAGLVSAPFVGVGKATDIIGKTREALTFKPRSEAGREAVEAIGTGAEAVTKLFRAPIAGFTGLAKLPQGIDVAAESTRDILNRGVGPVGGEKIAEVTGSPALGAVFSAIPVAIVAALGLRGSSKISGRLKAASDDVTELLKREGFDLNDASPANVKRVRATIEQFTAEQQARLDAFREVGIENPTRAQVTRAADDFQLQQETAKTSGRVRDTLEAQEATLAGQFDEAAVATQGRSVTSGSTVTDEIVGRSVRLDNEISQLYKEARSTAARIRKSKSGKSVSIAGKGASGSQPRIVDPTPLVKAIDRILPSDRAMKGLPESIRGNLIARGIIEAGGKVKRIEGQLQRTVPFRRETITRKVRGQVVKTLPVRKITVAEAEEIRIFINDHFQGTSGLGRSAIHSLKNALDDAVFKSAGQDIFNRARSAKAKFESDLAAAKISKFDKNQKSLVRDILENKIDPDILVDKVAFSKTVRASELKQLKDFLQQTENGVAAFNDLRAQVLTKVKEKSFIGPEDAQGIRALSRDKLEKSLAQIGEGRLKVLFSQQERNLLNTLLKVAKLREPVRGTALGRGPSAQAIEQLQKSLTRNPAINMLVQFITFGRNGGVVLKGKVAPQKLQQIPSPTALAVPAALTQSQ